MTEPINLNKARKVKARAEAGSKAAENRVKFGRGKAQKLVSKLEAERLRRELDRSKLTD